MQRSLRISLILTAIVCLLFVWSLGYHFSTTSPDDPSKFDDGALSIIMTAWQNDQGDKVILSKQTPTYSVVQIKEGLTIFPKWDRMRLFPSLRVIESMQTSFLAKGWHISLASDYPRNNQVFEVILMDDRIKVLLHIVADGKGVAKMEFNNMGRTYEAFEQHPHELVESIIKHFSLQNK